MRPDAGELAKRKNRSAFEIARGLKPKDEAGRKRAWEERDESEDESDESEGGRRKRVQKKHKEWWKRKKADIESREKVRDKE